MRTRYCKRINSIARDRHDFYAAKAALDSNTIHSNGRRAGIFIPLPEVTRKQIESPNREPLVHPRGQQYFQHGRQKQEAGWAD